MNCTSQGVDLVSTHTYDKENQKSSNTFFYPVIDHIKEGARCLNANDWTIDLQIWKEKKNGRSFIHSNHLIDLSSVTD